MDRKSYKWDVFVSYAREDRTDFVLPLVNALREVGIRVWFDENEIMIGSSISAAIDIGLRESRCALAVISRSYLEKRWPMNELRYFLATEGSQKERLLPIWHKVDFNEVSTLSPLLADRFAASSTIALPTLIPLICRALQQVSSASNQVCLASAIPECQIKLLSILTAAELDLDMNSPLSTKRVLIVEDDPNLGEILIEALEVFFEVKGDLAQSAEIASNMLNVEKYDLVTLDWMLPGRSGIEFAGEISLFHPETSFLFLTAKATLENEEEANGYPHIGYITKPFTRQEILPIFEDVLSDNGLHSYVIKSLKIGQRNYKNLIEAKSSAQFIALASASSNTIDLVVRHKLQDYIRTFCKTQPFACNTTEASTLLVSQLKCLKKLLKFNDQASIPANKFISEYLKARKAGRSNFSYDIAFDRSIILNTEASRFLKLCLVEIIDNALDSTKEPIHIFISSKKRAILDDIIYKISNTGPSINESYSSKIFEEGFSTKGVRRGHGLNLIQSLARAFRSEITLVSYSPVEFLVQLPISQ